MDGFVLDGRLAADTLPVGRFVLSRLRLRNDSTWPWCVLVPCRADVRELFELTPADRAALIDEIAIVGRVMQRLFAADKINVGALGNIVSQLHVHIVARYRADPAWPGPVWGHAAPARAYLPDEHLTLSRRLGAALAAADGGFVPDPEGTPAPGC